MVQTMIKIEHFFVSIGWCQQIFFVTSYAVSAYFTSRQSSVSTNDYSITSLVRASLVRGPSVVRGFERQNFSSHPVKIASK